MVPALRRAMERFHVACSAIEAPNLTHKRARQRRRALDMLQLIMEPESGSVDARKQGLYISRRPRDSGF